MLLPISTLDAGFNSSRSRDQSRSRSGGLATVTPHSVTSKISSWRLSDLSAAIRDAREIFDVAPGISGSVLTWNTLPLLLAVPFAFAARSIGYSWVVHSHDRFSPLVPLFVSQVALAAFVTLLLFVQHGAEDVQRLLSGRYVRVVVTGTLAGLAFCLQNLALTRITPTLLTVLMSTQSVTVAVSQALLLGTFPTGTQWTSLFAGLFLATQHVFCEANNVGEFDIIGTICGLGAASCLALAGLVFQYFVGQFASDSSNRAAEVKRLIIANESWKIPITLGIILVGDHEKIATLGFFHGWDWKVAFAASFLSFVMVGYRLLAISLFGALATTVAASAEVAIVFIADMCVLGRSKIVTVDALGLAALLLVVLMFNLTQLELQQTRKTIWQSAARELERIDVVTKQISKDSSRTSSNDLKARVEEEFIKCSRSLTRCKTV